ncbi:hypothetical protein S40293_07180 [Stachybotrys chartarum IBT 40293]|nr:hypothetical protein S40293_07180 [Stachybotrys chartarum IBT 40293]
MPSRSLPRASDYGKTWILSWTRNPKSDRGLLHGEFILEQGLQKNGISRGDPDTHQLEATILEVLKDEFREFLGESKYAPGLHTIPPSRFSNTNTNTNGIWEYSPFLCGAEKSARARMESIKRSQTAMHITSMVNPSGDRLLRTKPSTQTLWDAEWDLDRVRDEDFPLRSMMSMVRLSQTERVKHPRTGERMLQDAELVRRAGAATQAGGGTA